MNNKVKLWARRAICLLTATIVLSVAVGTRLAFGDTVVGGASKQMDAATNMSILASAMKNCATSSHVKRGALYPEDVKNHNVFQDVFDMEQVTGTYVEYQIKPAGSSLNGQVRCATNSDNLINKFAEAIGKSYEEIICGSNGSGGLLTATSDWYGLVHSEAEGHCGESGYAYMFNDDAQAYIQSLYEEWAKTNPYAVSWDKVGTFSDEQKYRALYYDLVTACGEPQDTGDIEVSTIDPETGAITTKYISPAKADVTSYRSLAYENGGMPVSCRTMAEKLNEYAETYSDEQLSNQGEICYKQLSKDIGNVTDQSLINTYQGLVKMAHTNGDYSVFYDDANRKCIELQSDTNTNEKIGGYTIDFGELNDPGTKTDEEDGPCYNNGVGALGWILCPIIKFMRQGIENLYDYVITPFLEINAEAFNTENGAFVAWQMFQSFANVAFVIFLLIIIFSQLTGVGIDNLGIKRMLPKLIVAAILVNLSYIICQLAVDASNLIGFSVRNLFEGMAVTAMNAGNGERIGVGASVGATLITGAVGVGGTVAAISTASFWLPSVLIAVVPALIGIIISILFMFVILGARQAAAVILVVISPLALVCYMLPNTKKLFDKWLNAFKSVLLVFPICGMLMGGGAFVGAVLWGISGSGEKSFFLSQLLAALMTVIPFFFIPRVLKASLNAIGNIGNMISGAGGIIGRGLGNVGRAAVKESGLYKNLQSNRSDTIEARDRQREQERAQRIVEKMRSRQQELEADPKKDRNGNLKKSYQRRLANTKRSLVQAQNKVLAGAKEEKEMERLSSAEYAQASMTKIEADARENAIGTNLTNIQESAWYKDENNKTAMENGVRDILDRGNQEEIAAMTRAMSTTDAKRSALRSVLGDVTTGGVTPDSQMAQNMQTVSGEVLADNNWKNEYDRRMTNWAAGGGSGDLASYDYGGSNGGGLASKVSRDYLKNADDDTIASIVQRSQTINSTLNDPQKNLSTEERSNLQKELQSYQDASYELLNSDAATNLKADRKDSLRSIATTGNYLNVRSAQQSAAQASARYNGVSDTDLLDIATNPRSTPETTARAQAEINRRKNDGGNHPDLT